MHQPALDDIADFYGEHGYYFPVDALSADTRLGINNQLNYPHVIFRFADAIARSEPILDVVESIIGPDILVWGSTLFIKEPHTTGFVSWHQGLRGWGLDRDDMVAPGSRSSP